MSPIDPRPPAKKRGGAAGWTDAEDDEEPVLVRIGEAGAGADVAKREAGLERCQRRNAHHRHSAADQAESFLHYEADDVSWSSSEDVTDRTEEGRRHALPVRVANVSGVC